MIKRIVKMTFRADKIEDFKVLFDTHKSLIRSYPGCDHLELWQDLHNKSVFMTYSYWDNEDDLQNYRNSDLFKNIWSKTKILFSDKPYAWSVDTLHQLN
jgi:heme-degrading monooxygenase HmoA